MIGGGNRPPALVAAALGGAVLLAAAPWWLVPGEPAGFVAARLLAAATLAAAIAGTRRSGGLPVAAAPAFVFPLAIFLLYSVGPFLYLTFAGLPALPMPDGALPFPLRQSSMPRDPLGYIVPTFLFYTVASPAEALVLALVGWLTGLACLADRLIPPVAAKPDRLPVGMALALIAGAGLAYQGLRPLAGQGGLVASLVDVLPGLVALGAGILIHRAASGGSILLAAFGLGLATAAVAPWQIKALAMLGLVGLFMLFLAASMRQRLVIAVGAVAVMAVAAIAVQVPRAQTWVEGRTSWSIGESLRWKLVLRQAESVFCLNFALAETDTPDSPAYFLQGLVPRALWPDKPSLSTGEQLGVAYCGMPANSGHSGSVTLLGEPVARAGTAGLAVAMAAIGLVLAGHLALWKRGSAAMGAVAIGLAPWLIDFDHIFGLYVPLAAKVALAQAAAMAVLTLLWRRWKRR